MRSSVACLALVASLLPAAEPPRQQPEQWRLALPGYVYQFPRDHFSHPEFRTEWWYYTGNLRTPDGRRFGYELTFFRHALKPALPSDAGVWDIRDVWMAHLALSDLDGNQFLNTERLNRSGAGLAGVDAERGRVWNGNWSVQWTLPAATNQKLRAVADRFSLDLDIRSLKPPVVQGQNGISQKAAGAGRASHYVSLTRLETRGTITLDGKPYRVEGFSWMDHEFFSHSMESNQAGWDWFSLQFTDGSELMLYRLRRKDGSVEPYSSGTWVDASGKSRHLTIAEFQLQPGRTWKSDATGAAYPIEWTVRVPSLGLECEVRTRLQKQELVGKLGSAPNYWEGAVEVAGQKGGTPIQGSGYLEMTGYAGAVRMGE